MRTRTLKVVPNPYSALDADGRAQGVVSREGHPDLYVGAVLDVEESTRTGKRIFKIDTETVLEVPATAYYMRRLQAGSLLPADKESAKYAGVEEKDFVEPGHAISDIAEKARQSFEETTGRIPQFAQPAQPPTKNA